MKGLRDGGKSTYVALKRCSSSITLIKSLNSMRIRRSTIAALWSSQSCAHRGRRTARPGSRSMSTTLRGGKGCERFWKDLNWEEYGRDSRKDRKGLLVVQELRDDSTQDEILMIEYI